MTRACDVCGKSYEAQRASSRYCSSSCRARKAQGATVREMRPPAESASESGVVAATRRELEAAGRLDSALGQAALVLARRVESDRDTGSAAAALVKEWRATKAEALKGVPGASAPQQ